MQVPDKHYVTVKAAIWKGDKLLLQTEERKHGKIVHDLPGGRIDKGEDIIEGLKREVLEEIGVKLINISSLPVKLWSIQSGGDGVVCILYEAEIESEDFNYNYIVDEVVEVMEAKFMTLAEFEPTSDFIHKKYILEYFVEKLG